MRVSDIGNDTDVWAGNISQTVHFPEMVDSHFQNSNLIFLGQTENRQWESDFIIIIPLCFQHPIFLF